MDDRTKRLRDIATIIHRHAGSCKKHYEDCKACMKGIAYFRDLPLQDLSVSLRESHR